PTMPLPSLRLVKVTPWSVDICQCTVRGAVPPLSATLKDTEPDWPTVAVVSCGCVVIAGAALTVRTAAALVAETWLASVTTTRYRGEPAAAKLLTVKVGVLLPTTPLPSLMSVNVTP